jgi:tight adherence protein B
MTGWVAATSLALAIALSGRRRPALRLACRDPTVHGASSAPRWLVAGAIGSAAAVARVPLLPVLGMAVAAAAVGPVRRRIDAVRQRERCSAATVEITFALAGELRAGRTPAQALDAVAAVAGPLRPALEAAGVAVAVGADPAGELARAAAMPGAERLRYVSSAWAVADAAGGRIAVVLERLSEAMDSDLELRQELDSAMAGPRATMVLLAGLPLLGLALGQAVGANPLELLLHRPIGWALLGAAAVLDGLGVIATRMIARSALRS